MSWSAFCSLPLKGKRVVAGLVGLAVETAACAVPGVGLAAKLISTIAEKTTEDFLDPQTGKAFPPEQLQQIQTWLGSLATSYDGLIRRLDTMPLPTGGIERLMPALKQTLSRNEELSKSFDACLLTVREQTLSLRFIEDRLDDFFHVQQKLATSLEEIKDAFVHSPLMSDWQNFRRARPEAVNALVSADEHFLAGRRDEGIAVMVELLRQRGVGDATLAHHLGLVELGAGRIRQAGERLRQVATMQATPHLMATLANLSTLSGRIGPVWRSLPRGFVINRKYRIEAEIGRGGMASVYRAVRTASFEKGAVVAIKVPAAPLMSDPLIRQRFEHEIDISRKLSQTGHAHIVHIHDYEMFDDPHTGQELYGLVMEHVEGESLARHLTRRRIASKPLSIEQTRGLMERVCVALEHAHSQTPPVLHRDLKPANIMVGKGNVKLMDFGIARVLDDARDEMTRTGQVVGTLAYLPPEAMSTNGVVDIRTDVYLAGNLLLELLTFDPAGDAESRTDCPAEWLELIADSMNRIRGKRPSSMAEFRDRLLKKQGPVLNAQPVEMAKPEPVILPPNPEELFRDAYNMVFALGREMARPEAIRILRGLAEKDHALAKSLLAACYQMAYGVEEDLEEARRWGRMALPGVKALAERGEAMACSLYGWQLRGGLGCSGDDFEAAKWFRKAADWGEAVGRWVISLWYRDGIGVNQDEKEAFQWARRAANQDLALAQTELGRLHESGKGCPKDEEEAVKWYRRAAAKGEPYAMNNLGVCYREARGVPRDDKEAVRWFLLAINNELPLGYCNLGYMYDVGRGVEQNYKEAVRWYRKAAEKNNSVAQYNLGICYRDGKSVEKNKDEAIRWFRKAAENGDADAKIRLKELGVS